MTLALKLASHFSVMMLCKDEPTEGSTYYAQGGVAAVLDDYDSVDSHCRYANCWRRPLPRACRKVCRRERRRNYRLVDLRQFDTKVQSDGSTEFHLSREGGHSFRRVIHAADATGREIAETLSGQLMKQNNIEIKHHYVAVDLITRDMIGLRGAVVENYALNVARGEVELFRAQSVVIATGGASKFIDTRVIQIQRR